MFLTSIFVPAADPAIEDGRRHIIFRKCRVILPVGGGTCDVVTDWDVQSVSDSLMDQRKAQSFTSSDFRFFDGLVKNELIVFCLASNWELPMPPRVFFNPLR